MPTSPNRLRDGFAALNQLARYATSPPTSLWSSEQRAEFFRIIASEYGVDERVARLWFTQATQKRPFLRPGLPDAELVGRIILCQLLGQTWSGYDPRSPQEAKVKGISANFDGENLRTLLEEPYVLRGAFHWDYVAYQWNLYDGDSFASRISFWLLNVYQSTLCPDWVPEELRPFPLGDPAPF